MECNKDEAIRAREIAEKKMQNNDFAGAKRFALKAQQLYSNLDSISMILAVCEVHCSAQNKIVGPRVSWYDVLQVEKFADETTIKKQYRKLALLLHPDKNKFAGAEAAFKLIGEANRVLSNKMTRSVFDSQVKASTPTSISAKPPFHPSTGSSSVNKQQNSEDKVRKTNSHIFRQGAENFWTCCPCCKTSYEYVKLVLGKQIACQKCRVTFIAYETVAPIRRSTADSSQSECFSGKGNSSSRAGPEAAGKGVEIKRESNGHSVRNSMGAPPAKAGLSVNKSKQKTNDADGVRLGAQKKGPKSDARKPVMAKAPRNTSNKRGRPGVVESSQISDGAGDVDVRAEVSRENDCTKLEGNSDTKRPSRNKRNALYRESSYGGSEVAESPKVPETVNSDNKGVHMGKISENCHSNGTSFNENVSNKKRKLKKQSANSLEEGEVETFEESDLNYDIAPDRPISYECLDTEFYDFDKDKERSCFSVGQIWACYDSVDAMPRFYAQIDKVYAPDFKLEITWLEAEADSSEESITKWINEEDLPTACGMFMRGTTEIRTESLMFSHQMCFKTGKDGSFVIYPRSREIWALFRNWDMCWSNDPEKHKPYTFDIVVVLSDFDQNEGIEVAYLKKLRGFVSLFQQTTRDGRSSFRIPPVNLFQFSHRVPHFQMSGNERVGVPMGSYELDTASLPNDFDEFDGITEKEMEKEKKDTAGAASCKQSKESHEEEKAASGPVQTRGASKKCGPNDVDQGSTSVKNADDLPKEASEIPPRNSATVVRRSPRVSLSKNITNNPIVT